MTLLWFRTTMLAIESSNVIALRLARFAKGGPGAEGEAVLMIQEKMDAFVEAGAMLMRGGSMASVVERYTEHVVANSDRLSR